LANGEVLRVWPEIDGADRIALDENMAAIATLDSAVWIVDLRD
jgi:hypothetical protein